MRRSDLLRLLPLPAAGMLFLACSSATCPTPAPADDLCGSGLYARFDSAYSADHLRPFPDPRFATHQPFKGGTTGYSPAYGGDFGLLLDTLDGFGTYAPIMVKFNDLIQPVRLPQDPTSSLDPTTGILLLDLEAIRADPKAPFSAVAVPFTAWYDSVQGTDPVNTLSVAPWLPLDPEHEYAMVLTDRFKSWVDPLHQSPARCVGPAPEFQCLKSRTAVDPSLEPVRESLSPLLDWLDASLGLARGDVSLALDFTTESVERELVDIHQQVEAEPPPPPLLDASRTFLNVSSNGKLTAQVKGYFDQLFPPGGVNVNFDDYDFSAVGKIAYGTYSSVDFREPTHKLFLTDGITGHVEPQGLNDLEFLVVEPQTDPAASRTPPWKVAIFQHALTVCKETMIAAANEFNKRGIALVGIDIVNHGSRSPARLAGGPPQCETAATGFLQIDQPLATRESFRQTVADEFQLVSIIGQLNPALQAGGLDPLVTTRLGFISQSLGSIIGATFVSLEPSVGAAVLNVGGGGLYGVALSFFGNGSSTGPDGFQQLPTALLDTLMVLQTAVERADPINYAAAVARSPLTVSGGKPNPPKSVLLQEAVGDSVVGNFTTDSLARQMGAELSGPTVFRSVPGLALHNAPFAGNAASGKVTLAESQFSPAKHSFLLLLDYPGAFCRGQIQAATFIDGYLSGQVPTVIDPYTDPATAACPTP